MANGVTIFEAICQVYPDFEEFTLPTVLTLNGVPKLRASWKTTYLAEGDIVAVTNLPADGGVTFGILTAITVLSILTTIVALTMLPKPVTVGSGAADPDPVYTLAGRSNTAKLQQPIEVAYGRNRLWPTYAAIPFTQYSGNEQYLYQLFCLGQGTFDIEAIQIEDTDIVRFVEVEYEVVEPGQTTTLVPAAVMPVPEVAGLELFGTNVDQHTVYGPFICTTPNEDAYRIECDLVFPSGLYTSSGSGTATCVIYFEVRRIDENGKPISGWFSPANGSTTITEKTTSPLRLTHVMAFIPGSSDPVVGDGRFEIRGRRFNTQQTATDAADRCIWEACRAFVRQTKDFGDVTLLAVKARATDNLNANISNKINVIATRKLKVLEDGVVSATAKATRSPAWALLDVLTSNYGGNLGFYNYGYTIYDFIDTAALTKLDEWCSANGITFDYVFNQKTTVWAACQAILRVARAKPVISGSIITYAQDTPATIPVGVFGIDNIVADSFRWEVIMPRPDDYDSVEVAYVDPTTGLETTVTFIPNGSQGLNPEKVTFTGCTSRAMAYHEAAYIQQIRRYIRENFTFTTGLEGHIPMVGDLIALSWPLPRFGVSGTVLELTGNTAVLSQPVPFEGGVQHYILLRRVDGSGDGPYPVAAIDGYPDRVRFTGAIPMDWAYGITIDTEPVMFAFGPEEQYARKCKVVAISPSNGEEVEINCVPYAPEVFAFDDADAPAVGATPTPVPVELLPVVKQVYVTHPPLVSGQLPNLNALVVSWTPANGAVSYRVEVFYPAPDQESGFVWSYLASTKATFINTPITSPRVWYRVAGIGSTGLQGPWCEWYGYHNTQMVPAPVYGLQLVEEVKYFALEWWTSEWATSYVVSVFRRETSATDSARTLLRSAEVNVPRYTYTAEMCRLDSVTGAKHFTFEVVARSINGDSTPTVANKSVGDIASPTDLAGERKYDTPRQMVIAMDWLVDERYVLDYMVDFSADSATGPWETIYQGTKAWAEAKAPKASTQIVYDIKNMTRANLCQLLLDNKQNVRIPEYTRAEIKGAVSVPQLNGVYKLVNTSGIDIVGLANDVPYDPTSFDWVNSTGWPVFDVAERPYPTLTTFIEPVYWRVPIWWNLTIRHCWTLEEVASPAQYLPA